MRSIVLLLLIMLVSLSACQNNPAQPELAAPEIAKQTAEKLKSVNTVHLAMTVDGGTMGVAGMNVRSLEGDLAQPDKMHLKAKIVALGSVLDGELITIGEQAWITNPLTKKWQKAPNVIAFTPLDANKGIGTLIGNAKDLQKLADDNIGGTAVYHLSGTIDGKDLGNLLGSNIESKQIPAEIWIGKAGLLPRQIKITGSLLPNEPQNLVRTIALSNYNAPVTIEAPQP
jgi:outer membrane lipoprotein-sorting protein